MKRKTKVFLKLGLAFLFLLISVQPVAADYRARVLGASTTTSNLDIPPTVEGPGLILPDSPLFFLDELKQLVRVNLAFSGESKAEVYEDIAGERLAELRFMLAKNNKNGIDAALRGISNNLQKASDELNQANRFGKNVSLMAKKINDDIRLKQQSLDVLESQTSGEMKAKVQAAQEALMVAKIKAEDLLSEQELKEEISYDLNRQIQRQVNQSSELAKTVEQDLDELKKEASAAAANSLKRREETIKRAIEEKNQKLVKEHELLLESEKKKNEKLLELEAKEAKEVMETVKKAQEAALKYQKIKKSVEEVKSQPPSISAPTPTPNK